MNCEQQGQQPCASGDRNHPVFQGRDPFHTTPPLPPAILSKGVHGENKAMSGVAAYPSCHDLHRFELSDMIELGRALRRVQATASSMEDTASTIVQYLYTHFANPETGEKNCVLIRFFKTHRYAGLEPDLQQFAQNAAGNKADLNDDTRCLTLLATAGGREEWNSRASSAGHQAIPLTNEEVVRKAPMVAQLIQQVGLDIAQVVDAAPSLMIDPDQRDYNVFHVDEALGSTFVPAQDFVRENNVKSVLGFGGLLPNGELFAVIMFARVYIPRETAEMFRTLALGIKLAVLPFARGPVFSKAA